MAKIRKSVKHSRQPVGKHPTRVPLKALPPPSASTTPKEPKISKPKSTFKQRSLHGMTTRRRARNFPFMDLPPEIRNSIYEHAYASTDRLLELSDFMLPQSVNVSRVFRSEALPVFFASQTFTAQFRSNWCVRAEHYHHAGYNHFSESGKIDLCSFLKDDGKGLELPGEAVRFQSIKFTVECACCVNGLVIGHVEIRVTDRKPALGSQGLISKNSETKQVWSDFIEAVEIKAKEIGERKPFNGFTIEDVKGLAMCFRRRDDDDSEDEDHEDHNH